MPSLEEICERYGEPNSRKVYMLPRDLEQKWMDLHERETGVTIPPGLRLKMSGGTRPDPGARHVRLQRPAYCFHGSRVLKRRPRTRYRAAD
jgi:hypothetical protein